MRASIRKFLLFYLLLAVTVTTTLTAVGNYYLDQKDIQEHLDTLMSISALSYQALLDEDLNEQQIANIQRQLNDIPRKILNYSPQIPFLSQPPEYYLDRFNFQIWKNHQLLLRSPGAPTTPLYTEQDGFSDKIMDNQKWRVFTTTTPHTHIHAVLAERYDTRDELGQRIALDDIYIMLLTFPLSGLLIWIIIGKGIDSIERVTQEVANRAPGHLESVNIQSLPEEIKPLIDELNILFARLKEAFEREKRFAADAAHELRTPLAALKTQVQVALNTNNIDEKNMALQKVIASVNRNTHIVQQLLTMSRLLSNETEKNDLDTVNLPKITREVLVMLAPTAIQKHIELELEDSEVNTFLGHPTAISILVRNLVDNAIRYTETGGSVKVKVYQEQQEIVLEIQDTGPGIPEALRKRVFERFFRALGNDSPGSGLGLAIVQQIIALHHARFSLDTPASGVGLLIRIFFKSENAASAKMG